MKKLWFILACVSMAVLVVVGAAVAFAPEHAHEFVAVTTKPTCTADGETVYTCSCGRTYSEKIAALGHKVVDLEGKEANCVEAGITAGSMCAVCNEVFVAQEKIPAFGHDIVELAAVEANCTEDGLTAGKYCTKCDYEVKQTVISASGHNIVADAAVTADSACPGRGSSGAGRTDTIHIH